MALRPSALVTAVPSASQKLTRVLPSPVSPDSSLCQLDAPLFGVCAHGDSRAWCQAPGDSGILGEPAPTSQCLAQDLPLPELVIPLLTAAAFSETAGAAVTHCCCCIADGACSFWKCCLNQLNKGGR